MKTMIFDTNLVLLDKDDYERLKRFKWHLTNGWGRNGKTKTLYVVRNRLSGDIEGSPRRIRMHRCILQCVPGFEVAHLNGNGLDNRKENLRLMTHHQNMMGFQRKKAGCHSKYRGVTLNKSNGKWLAYIQFNLKFINLGHFELEEDAAKARDKKALELFGEFAQLNIKV